MVIPPSINNGARIGLFNQEIDMKVHSGNPNRIRKTARRMPPKTARKKKFSCNDGPLKGHYLWLTDGITAIFTINGQTGRYNNGEWQQC